MTLFPMRPGVPMRFARTHVECMSGYRANERPVAFMYDGRRYEVEEILDRWYEGGRDPGRPVLDYFKVRARGGGDYFLRYHSLFDAWAVAPAGDA